MKMKQLTTTAVLALLTLVIHGQSIDSTKLALERENLSDLYYSIREARTKDLPPSIQEDSLCQNMLTFMTSDWSKNPRTRLTPDLYFDPRDSSFVRTIYAGDWISNGTEWGLYKYHFIIETRIGLDELRKPTRCLDVEDQDEMRTWWQSYMDSYNDPKYHRKHWASAYSFIPPPPPPPVLSEWLN